MIIDQIPFYNFDNLQNLYDLNTTDFFEIPSKH